MENRIKNIKGVEHPIGESDQEYKRGGVLQVKCLRIFCAKRHLLLKNENIRYDICNRLEFIPDKPFQPSLMFVSKDGACRSEESFRCSL